MSSGTGVGWLPEDGAGAGAPGVERAAGSAAEAAAPEAAAAAGGGAGLGWPAGAESVGAVVSRETEALESGRAQVPAAGPDTHEVSRETGDDRAIGESRSVTGPTEAAGAASPRSTRVITVANQKGGVGKTTTVVNLAAALALQRQRVLVVDLDPQGNATTGLGVDRRVERLSVYEVLLGSASLREAVLAVETVPGIDLVPATLDLAGAEIELVAVEARESRLRRALAGTVADYDFVFVDCPPSLGLLTVNALVAAAEVLIPIQCEYYALEGLTQLMGTVERVRTHLNPRLRISTVLLTMFDARTRLADQVAEEVRRHFGERVLSTVVPRSVRVSEAPGYGQPVLTYDPSSRGAQAYRAAADEMLSADLGHAAAAAAAGVPS